MQNSNFRLRALVGIGIRTGHFKIYWELITSSFRGQTLRRAYYHPIVKTFLGGLHLRKFTIQNAIIHWKSRRRVGAPMIGEILGTTTMMTECEVQKMTDSHIHSGGPFKLKNRSSCKLKILCTATTTSTLAVTVKNRQHIMVFPFLYYRSASTCNFT